MAFATANVSSSAFGDKKVVTGDWTGSAGDASGTINVGGGRVYLANFYTNNTTSPGNIPVPVTWPAPVGSLTTITVNNRQVVTAGTFIIIYA